ncbi:MAG TPA: 5-oxoprolinase subunit PxpB, partial [Burkholderiaceae bacterium]|nr:5-oxoprolinase subunit PxpB [Burkholderiaceae bacterium]
MIIEFGQRVDPEISARVRAVAQSFMLNPLSGVSDVVPAFTSVALHYRPESFSDGVPYEELRRKVEALLTLGIACQETATRVIEVPVSYGGEFGPDLQEVASLCKLSPHEVITRHAASAHVVYMLGFAPGFPYLGGLDPRLAVPRRATPRPVVPAGSVAIARDQSVIYPLATPGGWNLIGRTPLRLFLPAVQPPCLLQPGDGVRFVPISPEEYR